MLEDKNYKINSYSLFYMTLQNQSIKRLSDYFLTEFKKEFPDVL